MRLRLLYTIPVVLVIGGACYTPAPLPPGPAAPVPAKKAPQPAPPATPQPHGNRIAPALPPIPLVEGPLNPKLVFPERNQAITVRDSNFIFGSVGNGHARLTINGTAVPVAPNGTFLAYLPVPPSTAPRYELVTYLDSGARLDSARATIPVRVPRPLPDLALTGRLVVDSASVSPRNGLIALRDREPVRVTVRAPLNAVAWVTANGDSEPSARVAEPPSRQAAESPNRRAAKSPSRRAAESPSRRAAEPPSRRAAEPPSRQVARS